MEKDLSKTPNPGIIVVRRELCLGCGLCAQACHRGAISFPWGWAEIEQSRCTSCGLCLQVCPQGALVEKIPVSSPALRAEVRELRWRADDVIARIERLSGVA